METATDLRIHNFMDRDEGANSRFSWGFDGKHYTTNRKGEGVYVWIDGQPKQCTGNAQFSLSPSLTRSGNLARIRKFHGV
jgi:hypothetical protein